MRRQDELAPRMAGVGTLSPKDSGPAIQNLLQFEKAAILFSFQ
jgi:hypothetical protein